LRVGDWTADEQQDKRNRTGPNMEASARATHRKKKQRASSYGGQVGTRRVTRVIVLVSPIRTDIAAHFAPTVL
jgi:hypothetical protein